ncbi:peptidase S41 [bacterium]|nr:peptidase S41 [bacterium]|tara:strand:+ start:23366 stop:24637 length:1272 start_codon:yes stop_codon:yes gene_type:complete
MKDTSTRFILGAALIIVAFAGGVLVGGKGIFAEQLNRYGLSAFAAGSISGTQPEGVDFQPVWKAWNILDKRFIDAYTTSTPGTATLTQDEVDSSQKRVWGMIAGLVDSMGDPYTVFLPPTEAEIFQDDINGSFEGVGMEISIRDRVLTVVSPLKDTPAFNAGVKSGDQIVGIDGKSTKDININTAVKLIRGPKGSDVTFTIIRGGESEALEIVVTRDTIQIPTIETQRRADGIFIIELSNFSAKSPDLFRRALEEFAATNYNKLIIDLRGNPGGFLEAAVDMASWFLPSGKVVVTEDYAGNGENRIHRSRGYSLLDNDVQLVILIDRGTASASEILAGALREYGVATLVGTRTFGKGSVQELVNLTPDTSLKVTVARWLLAGEVFISREGIEPDILVEATEEESIGEDRDLVLEAAVQFLQKR